MTSLRRQWNDGIGVPKTPNFSGRWTLTRHISDYIYSAQFIFAYWGFPILKNQCLFRTFQNIIRHRVTGWCSSPGALIACFPSFSNVLEVRFFSNQVKCSASAVHQILDGSCGQLHTGAQMQHAKSLTSNDSIGLEKDDKFGRLPSFKRTSMWTTHHV